MRFHLYLSAALSLLTLGAFAQSDEAEKQETTILGPIVAVNAFWPDENPFGQIVNGEKNMLVLNVENKSDKNVTLLNIAGSVNKPETGALVKNLTTFPYGVSLVESVALRLPYEFFSEFKTGDIRLSVWLDYVADDTVYRVSAFEDIVQVVEPELSIFDFKLLSTYLISAAILGAAGYFVYLSYAPAPKRVRAKKVAVSTPVAVTATGAGGYQEEWVPEHHMKKTRQRKGGLVSGTSGDELSGAETSGAEGKKRKGRK
ncbi:hypothetical protein BD626DRAFT_491186 [Schizophyllum amplum]|uniref:Translocon-associated protein subunit alpha n=1 Tax=Schizophyllum amplum TaxID=97359 RepID=A0A550CHF7_9AGAR|nr:hypothetical protein BD626DRAFT_491186 [Auriculariopsis ampla]